jgi:UDP-N-acetylglucosamine diphosphorylase/glucosamine-1-phosphate N-acetyltransferase
VNRELILFDDRVARDWRPLSLTRPVGELLFGTASLRARAEHAYRATGVGHITADRLRDYDEPWAAPVLDPEPRSDDEPRVFLLSRFVPDPAGLPDEGAVLSAGDRVVGVVVPPGEPAPPPEFFVEPDAHAPDLRRVEVPGTILDRVWDLVTRNADRIRQDLQDADHAAIARDVHHLGAGPVSVGEGVQIAPGVVLDTRDGPIRLDDDVTVHPFTRLVGPAYVGPGSALLGGSFEAVSIGPVCKVHGEIEETVVLGFSNKAHDGFLGHAYAGMWVNLGALTTNSDLKNNYGTVRVWTPDGEVDTGERKIGCFLGDHVKTAIGTLLNTGTVVEAGANVFGGMPPRYLPPFSWGEASTVYEIDRFMDTARTVMGRRDVELTAGQDAMLRRAWEFARGGVPTG